MICYGTRHSRSPRLSCLKGPCVSGRINFSVSRPITEEWLRGIRIIHIGSEHDRWPIYLAGLDSTTRPVKTVVCITFREVTAGVFYQSRGSPAIWKLLRAC